MTEPVAIADTNALYRLLASKEARHAEHRKALGVIGHLNVSPMVLAELDCLITVRRGADAAVGALECDERRARRCLSDGRAVHH